MMEVERVRADIADDHRVILLQPLERVRELKRDQMRWNMRDLRKILHVFADAADLRFIAAAGKLVKALRFHLCKEP